MVLIQLRHLFSEPCWPDSRSNQVILGTWARSDWGLQGKPAEGEAGREGEPGWVSRSARQQLKQLTVIDDHRAGSEFFN